MIRILIADDELLELAVLKKTLQKNLENRCEIIQAENGREVLELYMEYKPQVLILDIEMPGMTGIEAAGRIREIDKNCSIIFLTAFDEFSYAKKAISERALDYLLKPFDEKELMLVVEEAIHRAEQTREEKNIPALEYEIGDTDAETVRLGRVAEHIREYIRENYVKDISMQDAAREMCYSEAYFSKLFKQCFGQTFTAYLTEYRVNEAKKLLEQPVVNIKDIGKAVGYGDANYFAKVFKRITGKTPSEYRNQVV